MARLKRRGVRDWPGLMKRDTARAYLDDMTIAMFDTLVTPHLDRRMVGGDLYFTRRSIDKWIEHGDKSGIAQTPEDLMRMLDDDGPDDQVAQPPSGSRK